MCDKMWHVKNYITKHISQITLYHHFMQMMVPVPCGIHNGLKMANNKGGIVSI